MPSDRIRGDDFFECKQCGECCKGFGGTYVGSQDIASIAAYLHLPETTVRNDFCVPSGRRFVLAQRADGYCIFWEKNCTIHPVKPLMCRRWPFIPGLLEDPANWYVMADCCPGIRRDANQPNLLAYARNVIECPER